MLDILPSTIRVVYDRAGQLDREGKSVVHMEVGRPDFDTPAHIKQAAIEALNDGLVHYTSNRGLPSLREAIADKLWRDNGLRVDPEREVVVTVGVCEGISISFLAFLNPGDEVLVPDPAFLNYFHCPHMAGARPVSYSLATERGFQPDLEEIRTLISPRTKMIVLNSPHNPTGAVLDRQILVALSELAIAHDLLVISDEIYEKIIYDGAEHVSIGSLPGMAGRTITLNGFSKAYAMDGWRLGYLAAPADLVNPMVRLRQYLTTNPTSFAQMGAVAALRGPQDCVEEMRQEFDRRRRFLVAALNGIEGLSCVEPRGAFYVFPSVAGLGLSSAEATRLFLEEAYVATVPGPTFGPNGEGCIRLAYSTSYASIEEAVVRLRGVIARVRACGRRSLPAGP